MFVLTLWTTLEWKIKIEREFEYLDWKKCFLKKIYTIIIHLPPTTAYFPRNCQMCAGHLQCWIELAEPWQWQVYMTVVSVVLFLIPALIISACYAIIVSTIWSKSGRLIMIKPNNGQSFNYISRSFNVIIFRKFVFLLLINVNQITVIFLILGSLKKMQFNEIYVRFNGTGVRPKAPEDLLSFSPLPSL